MIEKKLSVAKQMGYLQPKQLRNYIRSCDSVVILVLCECRHTILLSRVSVKPRGLEKYRHIFEGIIKKGHQWINDNGLRTDSAHY